MSKFSPPLPRELLELIIDPSLPHSELVSLSRVSRAWNDAVYAVLYRKLHIAFTEGIDPSAIWRWPTPEGHAALTQRQFQRLLRSKRQPLRCLESLSILGGQASDIATLLVQLDTAGARPMNLRIDAANTIRVCLKDALREPKLLRLWMLVSWKKFFKILPSAKKNMLRSLTLTLVKGISGLSIPSRCADPEISKVVSWFNNLSSVVARETAVDRNGDETSSRNQFLVLEVITKNHGIVSFDAQDSAVPLERLLLGLEKYPLTSLYLPQYALDYAQLDSLAELFGNTLRHLSLNLRLVLGVNGGKDIALQKSFDKLCRLTHLEVACHGWCGYFTVASPLVALSLNCFDVNTVRPIVEPNSATLKTLIIECTPPDVYLPRLQSLCARVYHSALPILGNMPRLRRAMLHGDVDWTKISHEAPLPEDLRNIWNQLESNHGGLCDCCSDRYAQFFTRRASALEWKTDGALFRWPSKERWMADTAA